MEAPPLCKQHPFLLPLLRRTRQLSSCHIRQWLQQENTHLKSCRCRAKVASRPTSKRMHDLETYKLFDEVTIGVRSGNGGKGEIVKEGKGRMVRNFKYNPGGQQPKEIFLPAGAPQPGEHGADVLVVVDPALDSLMHLHGRQTYRARNGANGNQQLGSRGSIKDKSRISSKAEPLRLFVPPGTVVKTKRGRLLGELLQPGQTIKVAQGGQGGLGVTTPSGHLPQSLKRSKLARGIEAYEIEDRNASDDAIGAPGEEVSLQLFLRVVADIGIVGLPNAGKSSLLAALTRASPEIADYPFTTLTPNLGVVQRQESFDRLPEDDFLVEQAASSSSTTLADLPGLIQGAHTGRGLGRMFLKHLRRTNAILHVLDASLDDPAADYWAVREELRMYNPSYCEKPHVVALNKMDLADASDLEQELQSDVLTMAKQLQEEHALGSSGQPADIISTSTISGLGIEQLNRALCQLSKLHSNAPARDR